MAGKTQKESRRNMKKLSIIIAAWNGIEYTKQCVAAASFYARGRSKEIVVIDNGSEDGTTEWLESQSSLKVVCSPVNRGTAWAYNQGIIHSDGNMLLFLHNDVVLTKDAIEDMEQALSSNDRLGAVAPLSNRTYYGKQFIRAIDYCDFQGMQLFADQVAATDRQNHQAMLLENFCLMVKREAVEGVNGFSEVYDYHYYEDLDFSLRLIQAGYRLQMMENLYVHHENGVSREAFFDIAALKNRNRQLFFKEWGFYPEYSGNTQEKFLELMDLQSKDITVLEVGCACGATLMRISEQQPSARLYGIEINKHAAMIAGNFGVITAMDVEKLEHPEWMQFFDYILFGDVVEHLKNPWKAIQNMGTLLKPGGILLFSVPNVIHISVIEQLLHGRWKYDESGILDKTHLRFFTKYEITTFLKSLGYRIEYVSGHIVPETSQQNALRRKLCALDEVKVDENELKTYQWYIVAKKDE